MVPVTSRPGNLPAPRELPLRRKVLFAGISLLLMLILGEGAVRLRAWMKYGAVGAAILDEMTVLDPASKLRVPRPGYRSTGRNTSISINSLGFRGEDITPAKPPRTVRIACVGASTTFSADVSNDNATWPARLQETLQREYPDVTIQVINAGVPGFVITESAQNIRTRVLPLDPDLVIYYEANNDIALDTRTLAVSQGLVDVSKGRLVEANRWLTRHSLLVDLVEKNAMILSVTDQPAGKVTSLPKDLPSRFIGELSGIEDELRSRNIPLLLSTFVVKYRRDQPRETQLANANLAFFYMPWMTIDSMLDAIDEYNAAIVEFGRSHNVPVVDDRTFIPADSQHFVDWAHMTDAGCLRMAERFHKFLQRSGLMQQVVDRSRRSTSQTNGPTHP
jgi:hypothetical protein